jgi:hypothetical protein
MSNRINRYKYTYQLRELSSIINGEQIIPFNTYIAKSNRSENSKKMRNLSEGNKFSKKKKVNQKFILNNRGKGIDLNKVCGSSHPSRKSLNIFINKFTKINKREETKNDFVKNNLENDICNFQSDDYNEINEKDNYKLNTYIQRPFTNNNIYTNYDINKNNDINYNSRKDEFLNTIGNNIEYINSNNSNNIKRNKLEVYNNPQQNCDLKNILKKEYLLGNERKLNNEPICNQYYNCINEQQYQSSLPSNIPFNEIINCPGESISITAIDNLVNKNKINDNKENQNFNDIYYRINEYQNKYNNTIRNNTNYNGKYNNINNASNKYLDNKNIKYYYEDKNKNKPSINNNNVLIPTLLNKEIYYSNKINKSSIINNKDYLTLNKDINSRNNDFRLKIKRLNSLNISSFTKSIYHNETGSNTSRPSKYFLKPVFDFTSTKDFMRTFSPRNSKQTFTEFSFNETYRPNKKLIEHNFFGIQKDEKRIDQLLKKIPRHSKEEKNEKFSNYSMYKLFKDRSEKIKNKRINNFLILTKTKNVNVDNDTVMPPNKIIYNNN